MVGRVNLANAVSGRNLDPALYLDLIPNAVADPNPAAGVASYPKPGFLDVEPDWAVEEAEAFEGVEAGVCADALADPPFLIQFSPIFFSL